MKSQKIINRSAQVVTTVSPIGSGPRLKSTGSNVSLVAIRYSAYKEIHIDAADGDTQHNQAHGPVHFIAYRQDYRAIVPDTRRQQRATQT